MANPEHIEILKHGAIAWNEWRADNPDIRVDLSEANLSKVNLNGANLSGTNLSGVDLTEANLIKSDFSNTNLIEANLSWADASNATLLGTNLLRADLSWTNFSRANLTQADLTQADLSNADLTWSNLSDTNLSRSKLWGTRFIYSVLNNTNFDKAKIIDAQFTDINLGNTIDLESTSHEGPSEISINTLIKSNGKIPDVFLRGCGIPEDFVNYLPSLLNKPVEFYSCFISYSHEDKAFAHQLHDFLQGRGIRCWLDSHQILPGHHILDEVDRGIKLWDKTLFCASKHSLNSDWVDKELTRAFKKEKAIWESRKKRVRALIPLDLDGSLKDWDSSKAADVQERHIADFTGWETDNAKMRQQFERVLKALRTDEGRQNEPIQLLEG